ncbi:MAG: hypothetical protein U0Q16_33520 [Bryobacteraceae bacterium]
MEIHPPSGPVSSPREFFIHMSMITMGILIALSLEGLREWYHHKALVREAKEMLATEMRENKGRVDDKRQKNVVVQKDIESAVAAVDGLLKTGKLTAKEMKVGYQSIGLQDSAWKTASITGAVGHMSYSEVKGYADVYTLQEEFVRNQRRGVEAIPSVMKSFHGVDDPSHMSKDELMKFKDRALDLLGVLLLEDSIGKGLSEVYAKHLTEK